MCFGCLFVGMAAMFPRLGLLIVWAFTDWVEIAFDDNWFWPLRGLIFLPFTTLLYVFVDIATIGDINLGGWLLIGLGALLDISHWAQTFANRRNAVTLYGEYGPGHRAV
ncbi:MAG: hypothetical protein ACRDJE_27615 [Dehalococcoidia bacterium]